jgi:hypothetical protein
LSEYDVWHEERQAGFADKGGHSRFRCPAEFGAIGMTPTITVLGSAGIIAVVLGSHLALISTPSEGPTVHAITAIVPGPMRAANIDVHAIQRVQMPRATLGNTPSTLLAEGRLRDSASKPTGSATLARTATGIELRLTTMKLSSGRDFDVWLSTSRDPKNDKDVLRGKWVQVGRLKRSSSMQIYTLPANFDPREFRSLVIWIKETGVLQSVASLKSVI